MRARFIPNGAPFLPIVIQENSLNELMGIIRSALRMAKTARRLRREGKRIGFVPTMGALHEGHLSLIRKAAHENDVVIVSIFVNPLQFGPGEDFARYPRPLRRDVRLARNAGAEIIFAPSEREFYSSDFETRIDPGGLAELWEGRSRPGHFRGVATVVALLFHLTQPTHAYFGQKDYQQALIIRRMVKDLRFPLALRLLPTVREPDGLAMSSRNAYLSVSQRAQAIVLYQALKEAEKIIRSGARKAAPLLASMRRFIKSRSDAHIDYAVIADASSLKPQSHVRGRIVILLAARIGRTRLIDNLLLDVS